MAGSGQVAKRTRQGGTHLRNRPGSGEGRRTKAERQWRSREREDDQGGSGGEAKGRPQRKKRDAQPKHKVKCTQRGRLPKRRADRGLRGGRRRRETHEKCAACKKTLIVKSTLRYEREVHKTRPQTSKAKTIPQEEERTKPDQMPDRRAGQKDRQDKRGRGQQWDKGEVKEERQEKTWVSPEEERGQECDRGQEEGPEGAGQRRMPGMRKTFEHEEYDPT